MSNISPQEAKQIAKEACIFGFPFVSNYRIFINRLICKDPLLGEHIYELRFDSGDLPPVDWFWSLTLYDAETTAMYPHPLERDSIGDRTEGIIFDGDGSLNVTIGHGEPEDKSNWLPAPEGGFYLILRLYAAKPEVLAGKWTPPPVRRIN